MIRRLIAPIRSVVRWMGFDINRYPIPEPLPTDLNEDMVSLIREARPYTMTTNHRLASMLDVVLHAHRNKIDGAIVECGVWRGGNMLLAASLLRGLGDTNRDLYLYDTFQGMTPPTDVDRDYLDIPAHVILSKDPRGTGFWCEASLEDVKETMAKSGYPTERIHLVCGPVEETIPRVMPESIAVLRLDTDWYESTKHELVHLYPRVTSGGVLVIDDYGHWQGARRAVTEYLAEQGIRSMLTRVDYSCRVLIKDL